MAEIVYVLFNVSMPTLTRVGVLKDGGDPAALMKELYTENIPLPHECIYACKVEDSAQAEGAVYEKFAEQKLGRYGDFADVEPARIVEALRTYEVEDVTEHFRAAFDAELEDDVKEARARFTARRWPWKSKPPA